jgi:hypothetical protein
MVEKNVKAILLGDRLRQDQGVIGSDHLAGAGPFLYTRQNGGARQTRRLWKRFQMMAELPEKDQRAVIRLINSLVSLGAEQHLRKAG